MAINLISAFTGQPGQSLDLVQVPVAGATYYLSTDKVIDASSLLWGIALVRVRVVLPGDVLRRAQVFSQPIYSEVVKLVLAKDPSGPTFLSLHIPTFTRLEDMTIQLFEEV